MITKRASLLTLLFAGFMHPAASPQDRESVLLRWNVPEGKAIGFKASLQQAGPAGSNAVEFNVDALSEFAGTKARSKEIQEKMKAFFEGFKLPKEYAMTALLKRPGPGDITVLLIAGKAPEMQTPIPEMTEMLKKMEGTVQLRGQVDDQGQITSFWLTPQQKNLLSLICELPKDPVKIGDHWEIHLSLIQMGFGFIAEKAKRVNRVELSALEKSPQGEVVAVLDYATGESVEGEFTWGISRSRPRWR